jgi:Flp pilus assembly protein TadD
MATPPKPPATRPGQSVAARAGLAVSLLLLLTGLVMLYPPLAAAYHRRQARLALDQDDFPRARAALRRAQAVQPRDGETLLLLARACRHEGDVDAALEAVRQAREVHRTPARVELEQKLIQAQSGYLGPVEAALHYHLANGHAEEEEILEALTRGYLQTHLLDKAYRATRLWIERRPDAWRARYWHGVVLEEGLRFDLAAEAYREALQRKPGHAPSRLRLAQVLLRRQRYGEALPEFETCLEADPTDATTLVGLVRCQRGLGRLDDAEATLGRVLRDHPDDAGALLLRGQLALDGSDAAEAVPWLRRAVERLPLDLEAHQTLAAALRLVGRGDEAAACERRRQQIEDGLRRMEEITKSLIERPDDVELRREAGATMRRLGQEREAVEWLLSAFLIDPGHEPTRQALAEILPRLGDPKLVERYRRILEKRGGPTPSGG